MRNRAERPGGFGSPSEKSDMDFIPVSTPSLSEADAHAVASCVADGWISSEGPQVPEFEEMFARAVGVPHAIAV